MNLTLQTVCHAMCFDETRVCVCSLSPQERSVCLDTAYTHNEGAPNNLVPARLGHAVVVIEVKKLLRDIHADTSSVRLIAAASMGYAILDERNTPT